MVIALVAGIALAYAAVRIRQNMLLEETDDAFIESRTVLVGARISGQIKHVYITDNQEVQSGTLLAEIDPADSQAQLQRAKANLAAVTAQSKEARLSLELLKTTSVAGLNEAKHELALSIEQKREEKAMVQSMVAQKERAESDFRRLHDMPDRYTPHGQVFGLFLRPTVV